MTTTSATVYKAGEDGNLYSLGRLVELPKLHQQQQQTGLSHIARSDGGGGVDDALSSKYNVYSNFERAPHDAGVYVTVILSVYVLGLIILLLHHVKQRHGQVTLYDIYFELMPSSWTDPGGGGGGSGGGNTSVSDTSHATPTGAAASSFYDGGGEPSEIGSVRRDVPHRPPVPVVIVTETFTNSGRKRVRREEESMETSAAINVPMVVEIHKEDDEEKSKEEKKKKKKKEQRPKPIETSL